MLSGLSNERGKESRRITKIQNQYRHSGGRALLRSHRRASTKRMRIDACHESRRSVAKMLSNHDWGLIVVTPFCRGFALVPVFGPVSSGVARQSARASARVSH